MKMKAIINVGGATIIAAMLATPAAAQEPGTYAGTSADGSPLSFTVTTDIQTGEAEVTSAQISYSAL
jgi:hypothetical protein